MAPRPRTPATPLVTVGYERRSVDELVAVLLDHGVELVVDVRLDARSRKPGFARRRLAAALGGAGIGYRHEPALGNPRDNRDAFHAGDPDAIGRYLERMEREGRPVLDELAQLVQGSSVALLCYERDPGICHRTLVAAELTAAVPGLTIAAID